MLSERGGDIAIRASGLSKMYRIVGPRSANRTLREILTDAAFAPFRRVRSVLRGDASLEKSGIVWALKDLSFEVSEGEVIEFDLTDAISGEGIYSFGLKNHSSDGAKYSSKEGSLPPLLVVETAGLLSRKSGSTDSPEPWLVRLPGKITLRPNYPNPFNQATQIEYGLPRAAGVELTVHNLLGQVVRALLNENQSAGYKQVLWNGTDNRGRLVGSGVFFIQLRVGEKRWIRRVTHQK